MDPVAVRLMAVLEMDLITQHSNMMRQQLALDVAECIRRLHVLLHDLISALHGHGHIFTTYKHRNGRRVLSRCMESMRGATHLFFEGNALLHIL